MFKRGRRRPRDFAIFYRVNALSRSLEFALRDFGIPYQMVNGLEFYQRKEIKDVLAYLHLLNNPRDNVAFLRVINTPPRGIGRSTIQQLVEYAARKGKSLLEAAREAGLIESLNKRAAVAVAKFVAMYRPALAGLPRTSASRSCAQVLERIGLSRALAESEDAAGSRAAGEHRGTDHGGPRIRRSKSRQWAARRLFGARLPGERHRRLGSGRRSSDADDDARREGAGISGRIRHRRRRGAACRTSGAAIRRTNWKKSGGCCSSV